MAKKVTSECISFLCVLVNQLYKINVLKMNGQVLEISLLRENQRC